MLKYCRDKAVLLQTHRWGKLGKAALHHILHNLQVRQSAAKPSPAAPPPPPTVTAMILKDKYKHEGSK